MKLVVIGSEQGDDPKIMEIARELGKLATQNGITIVTGGGKGLPLVVARTCKETGGTSIGISPAINENEHTAKGQPTEEFVHLHFVGGNHINRPWDSRLKYRNVDLMEGGDVVVVICGGWGTLTEFGINATIGKPVYIITGTGGYADCVDGLIKKLGPPKSYIYYCTSAQEVIDWILAPPPDIRG